MTPTKIHMVGNAHLDPAWMWRWDEGMEAFLATVRSALERMRETDGFVFTCSSALHYSWIERCEPEMFAELRQRVEEGRWCVVGGWWTQADCNLPSGEGFVRQALLAQRWFQEKLGRTARVGYSPDAFGHAAGLPQLLARAGMKSYIFCRPDPGELPLEAPIFRWRSDDGSQVVAYRIPYHYNMYESSVPKKVGDLERDLQQPSPLVAGEATLAAFGREWMLFYGVGNHGGGPTREHIRQIIEINADPSRPELIFSSPDRFFDEVSIDAMPERSGELQLNAPGCYSADSTIKRLNRRAEYELMAAERLAWLASQVADHRYPAEQIRGAWENVCFNHFHDILCGVAIREALDDAVHLYGEALATALRVRSFALRAITRHLDTRGDGATLVVVNPHAWQVRTVARFELWHDIDKSLWSNPVDLRVTDDDGNELPIQQVFPSGKIGRDRIGGTIPLDLPPLGWRSYRLHYGEPSTVSPSPPVPADGLLENRFVCVEIDRESGCIGRFTDRVSSRVIATGARVDVIDDPTDTWGHGVERFDRVVGSFTNGEMRRVAHGATHSTIRTRATHRSSWIEQEITLHHDSPLLHVRVRLFWGEHHRLVRLRFETPFVEPLFLSEAPYASIERAPDGIERPIGAWCALVDPSGEGGIGVATDAKHGGSALRSALSITLLRSPSYATHDPHPFHPDEDLAFQDQGIQEFSYVVAPVPASDARSHLHRIAAELIVPPLTLVESPHEPVAPELPRCHGSIRVEPSGIVATVVKRSEDGPGTVVRLFESSGGGASGRLELDGMSIPLTMRPHELRTLLLRGGEAVEIDLPELRPIDRDRA